jgi:HAD superfamily hydrolase (TIGR01450 family)
VGRRAPRPAPTTLTRPAAVPEAAALAAGYRGIVLDLDGVVYLGEEVVPAAPAALEGVRGLGVRLAFVTNNSFRPPELVTEKLGRLGVKAAVEEVLTSAQATVHLLGGADGLRGTRVLVVGGPGLRQALEDAGARLLDVADWRQAEVVAVGFDPDLTYDRVKAAALAIRAGARFVGSNPDTTLPTPEGFWPGAGATLAMLRAATGVQPEVAGKPERALLETAAAAIGPGPYLMVGDRADTDLDGAHRLGWATALVLSGVVTAADLPDLAIAPDHLLADVGGLLDPPGPVIRQATQRDARAAAALLAGCEEPAAAHQPEAAHDPADHRREPVAPRDPAGERREAAASRDPAHPADPPTILVAADGDRVVGAVAWRRRGELAVVTGPVVERSWRDRLVGTRLLVGACVAARAAGLGRVAAPDHGFLARFGFRPPGPEGPDGALVRELRAPRV